MRQFKLVVRTIIILALLHIVNTTTLKLYLPWYRWQAMKLAEEYYYERYERGIKYVSSECNATFIDNPFYWINFQLKDQPEREFNVFVSYDMNYNRFGKVKIINGLNDMLASEMWHEEKGIIQATYGSKVKADFYIDGGLGGVDEYVTLEEVKETYKILVRIKLHKEDVTEKNLEAEAEKLFQCYNALKERGYQLNRISYNDISHNDFAQEYTIDELSSVEDARRILGK